MDCFVAVAPRNDETSKKPAVICDGGLL